jgi:integrase
MFNWEASMAGCRRLTDEEIPRALEALGRRRFAARDQALFVLGTSTGYRVSELLAVRLKNVYQAGKGMRDHLKVPREFMKKGVERKPVKLSDAAKAAVLAWIRELEAAAGAPLDPEMPLFVSRQGGKKAIGRTMAWTILTGAYKACGFTGKLGTHTMRKTFAQKAHEAFGGDLYKTQQATGHRSLDSLAKYLSENQEVVDDTVANLNIFGKK